LDITADNLDRSENGNGLGTLVILATGELNSMSISMAQVNLSGNCQKSPSGAAVCAESVLALTLACIPWRAFGLTACALRWPFPQHFAAGSWILQPRQLSVVSPESSGSDGLAGGAAVFACGGVLALATWDRAPDRAATVPVCWSLQRGLLDLAVS